jgi:hypothetical protein
VDAENELLRLKASAADQAAADAVKAKIDAIGTVTLDSKAAIEAARAAYNALTDAQKALVSNIQVLNDAEKQLNLLEASAADQAAAKLVEEKIDAIGNVTVDSEAKINEARNLQNELKKAGERQRAADAKIRQLQQRIAKLEADAREFAKANKLEATGGDIEIKNWARGSVDARMATIGTVTKVSKDYGYIVIDFGTETTVIQTIGKKQIPVNPDLQSGLKFNVVRGEKFVAAVTLRIVDKKESTADIPPSKVSDIQVGDKVVFAK